MTRRRKIFSPRRTFPPTEIGVCNGGSWNPKIPISNRVKLFHTFLVLEDRMETESMIEEDFSDDEEEENIFSEENISSDRNRGV